MDLRPGQRPPALTAPRPLVTLQAGSSRLWAGRGLEIDWVEGTFSARGLCREGEGALAFDLSGPTTKPGDAIFFSSVISWGALETMGAVGTAPASEFNTISDLMDAYALQEGKSWAVTPRHLVYTALDPTTPSFHVLPGLDAMGVSEERQVTRLMMRYVRASDLSFQTVWAEDPDAPAVIQRAIEVFDRGAMTPTEAQNLVNQIFAKASPTKAFTGGITVGLNQVVDKTGASPSLAKLTAGHMYRVHGMRDPRNSKPYTDFVCAESIWKPSENEVTLMPTNVVASDFASIVEQFGGTVSF
ncbi:hypothetical protein ACLM5J_09710 [Nocardioides sp. Bht2]|uniref:hypothetical protein n=1 Tax=Nocardioides sp. Bht2 TaxID=3392297 RepID=UPI0039B62EFD